MLRQKKAYITLFTVLVAVGLTVVPCCNRSKIDGEPAPSYTPLITEISPQTTETEFPWIELHNPTGREVDASGMVLVINDDYRYEIPGKLPAVPSGAYLIIILDGRGAKEDEYKFREGKAELHAGPELRKSMKRQSGQIAVFEKGDQDQEKLVDFVSWGSPGSKASLTPDRNRIWRKDWFVPQVKTFGDYDENMLSEARDFTIARYPGRVGHYPSDWVVLYGNERTRGSENRIPGVRMFNLGDDAVVRSEDIRIGWTSESFAEKYLFQIARDPSFKDIVEEINLTEPLYKPQNTLPEGKFYYRVKVIDKNGRESSWSRVMTVNSRLMKGTREGTGEDGAVTAEVILTDMQHKYQKKDTELLCLDGCDSHLNGATTKHWDNVHPEATPSYGDHGDMNCVRASISMMVSFYGKTLSQDRIAYFTQEERTGVGDGIPEGDLAHSDGMGYSAEETAALEWALDETIADFFDSPNPSFSDLKGWLDASRPIMTRTPGHLRTMNGYREEDDGTEWVQILDPWSGPRWETYTTWDTNARGTWVGPVSAPNAREDEPEIWTDSDNDGVMDFDEQIRFSTGPYDADSDNDDVNDKEDIYEYVFQFGDVYSKRDADFDTDGVRKEIDPDNDGDTFNDGCEDQNGNGIFESALGETDNFATDAGLTCGVLPIHAIIVFDRSGSMSQPAGDTKYDRASDAATLFLDTWLANSPPAQTEVGLVYYDHNAYLDANAATNTTLDLFDSAKRDKIVASFSSNSPSGGATSIGGGILEAMGSEGFDISSVSADYQHRVIVVLTDGKENTGTRMDDPSVTQALVDGKVDGYVLGIGDESYIDEGKLSTLAEILNHPPASFAKDLDEFELEKFFLQVLAETQGLEFSSDPVEQISIGATKAHTLPVNPGAEKVTFVIVWNEKGGKIDFTLKDPSGSPATADVIKNHDRYQVSTKVSPAEGDWTLDLAASAASPSPPSVLHYSIMALEKNPVVSGRFAVRGFRCMTGGEILLTATLSQKKRAILGGMVAVKAEVPTVGLGTFTSKVRVSIPDQLRSAEKGVKATPLDMKYQLMAEKKMEPPKAWESVKLNDEGNDGDEIPGDGTYSAIFRKTRYDGIYSFRFIAAAGRKGDIPLLNRERTFTVNIGAEIEPKMSGIDVVKRDFRAADRMTRVTLAVVPKDRFGNLIGPGHSNLLRLNVKQARVVKVTDKLDGSYLLEFEIRGNYKDKPLLAPLTRSPGKSGKSLKG